MNGHNVRDFRHRVYLAAMNAGDDCDTAKRKADYAVAHKHYEWDERDIAAAKSSGRPDGAAVLPVL